MVLILAQGALALVLLTSLWWWPGPAMAWEPALRGTAWQGALLFLSTYTASAFYLLRRGALTAALLRRRRRLGLAFALVMAIHLVGVAARVVIDPERFSGDSPLAYVPGALLYAAVALLTLTSFAPFKERMTKRTWKRLHRLLSHGLWAGFAVTFAFDATRSVASALFTALFLIALALRLRARAERRVLFAGGTGRACSRRDSS